MVTELKSSGKKIAAYGASAKGNTLLNYCKITELDIDYIVDDTPEKQGFLAPGSRIPIVDQDYLVFHPCDYILILAWNFKEEIIAKIEKNISNKQNFIVPIPSPEIL